MPTVEQSRVAATGNLVDDAIRTLSRALGSVIYVDDAEARRVLHDVIFQVFAEAMAAARYIDRVEKALADEVAA